jgi:regulator of PEP synthase PpsR (kinase-PPPase family)
MSRRNDWGLFDAQKKRDRLNQIREDRLAKEQAQAAAEAARLAEIEAAEQAKRRGLGRRARRCRSGDQ